MSVHNFSAFPTRFSLGDAFQLALPAQSQAPQHDSFHATAVRQRAWRGRLFSVAQITDILTPNYRYTPF